MKLLTEYLERAIQLEHLASGEPDSTFKKQLVEQAKAYRKLAAKRAKDYAPAPQSARARLICGSQSEHIGD